MQRRPFEGDGPKRPLTDIPEYADVAALTTRLLDAVDQLPRTYSVLVSIPHNAVSVIGPAVSQGGLDLTPDVKLFTVPEGGGPYAVPEKQDVLPFILSGSTPTGITPGSPLSRHHMSGIHSHIRFINCSCGAPLTPGSLLTSVPFVTSVPLNGHIVEPRPAKRRADGVQLCRRVHDFHGPYHGVSSSLATS